MKKVLYVILALVLLYLVLCIAGPSNVHVERSATINASTEAIQSQLVDYNKFAAWSPWAEKDPNMKTSVEGEPGKPGHKYSWEGNKDVGKGTMEVASVSADTFREILNFEGKGTSPVYFAFKPEGAATNVTWGMDMKVPFFGRGMMMFFKGKMDAMLGGDFEKGLAGLAKAAEGAKEEMAKKYDIQEMGWAERTYAASAKTNLSMDKAQSFFAENFPKLFAAVQKEKLDFQSAPSALYYSLDDKTMSGDMAAAVGIPNGKKVNGWETVVLPACKVLFVAYYGPYNQIGDAHNAIGNYIKEKNLTKGDLVVEEYITDPGTQKDSTKWQTNIYYVLK